MNILTRAEAKKAGVTRYFTGNPCKHGHIAARRMSDGCVECADLHARTWQAENPEKVKAKGRNHRRENREQLLARGRQWRLANPEKSKELTDVWRAANAERVKKVKLTWRRAKAAEVNAATMRRQAAKLKRTPVWADRSAIRMVYRAAEIAKVTWPEVEIDVDHVFPLQGEIVSGLHVHTNLQILSARANRIKSNIFQGA